MKLCRLCTGWILVAAAALAGCGDDVTDAAADETMLAGVYSITSHTQNDAGCASAGTTVTGMPGFLVIAMRNMFGGNRMTLELCDDVTSCRATAAAATTTDTWFFPRGSDADGWSGERARSSVDGGQCSATHIVPELVTGSTGTVTFTVRETDVSYPEEAGGCPLSSTATAAQSEPCSRLETVQATFSAAL